MSEYIAKASIDPRDYRVVFLIQKSSEDFLLSFLRRRPDLNRRIEVLQTFALPLGYDAILNYK